MQPVIKRLRRDARITQRKLAEDLDRKQVTIKRWERGDSEPPFSLVCLAVKKYELNILRYTFSASDLEELCNRGFGDYALKLDAGHYISFEMLIALHDRDWTRAEKIRKDGQATVIAEEIWNKIKAGGDIHSWGRTPEEAAKAAYGYFEEERWENLAESLTINKLSLKFKNVMVPGSLP